MNITASASNVAAQAGARAADGDFKTKGVGHEVRDADGDYKQTKAAPGVQSAPGVQAASTSGAAASTGRVLAALLDLRTGGA